MRRADRGIDMSEPNNSTAAERSCDADILDEVSTLLQDSACLHYALAELIADAHKKLAAAQASALFNAISAQLRAHSATLGMFPTIRDADRVVISHRGPALSALAHADHVNAHHHIALCDAEALRWIEQRCSAAGLTADTENLLRMAHGVLVQSAAGQFNAKSAVQSPP